MPPKIGDQGDEEKSQNMEEKIPNAAGTDGKAIHKKAGPDVAFHSVNPTHTEGYKQIHTHSADFVYRNDRDSGHFSHNTFEKQERREYNYASYGNISANNTQKGQELRNLIKSHSYRGLSKFVGAMQSPRS